MKYDQRKTIDFKTIDDCRHFLAQRLPAVIGVNQPLLSRTKERQPMMRFVQMLFAENSCSISDKCDFLMNGKTSNVDGDAFTLSQASPCFYVSSVNLF